MAGKKGNMSQLVMTASDERIRAIEKQLSQVRSQIHQELEQVGDDLQRLPTLEHHFQQVLGRLDHLAMAPS